MIETGTALAVWPVIECEVFREIVYFPSDGRVNVGNNPVAVAATRPLLSTTLQSITSPVILLSVTTTLVGQHDSVGDALKVATSGSRLIVMVLVNTDLQSPLCLFVTVNVTSLGPGLTYLTVGGVVPEYSLGLESEPKVQSYVKATASIGAVVFLKVTFDSRLTNGGDRKSVV